MSIDEITIGGDSADIPAGTYPGTLTSIEERASDAFGAFLAWDFTLDAGNVVGGATSLNHGKRSKLYRWSVALGVAEGGKLSTAIGKPCLVVVTINADGWPKVSDIFPPLGSPVAAGGVLEAVGPTGSDTGPHEDLPF